MNKEAFPSCQVMIERMFVFSVHLFAVLIALRLSLYKDKEDIDLLSTSVLSIQRSVIIRVFQLKNTCPTMFMLITSMPSFDKTSPAMVQKK